MAERKKTKAKAWKPKTPKGRNRKKDLDKVVSMYLADLRGRTRIEWSLAEAGRYAGSMNLYTVAEKLGLETHGATGFEQRKAWKVNIEYVECLAYDIPARLALVWGRAMQNSWVRR